MGNDITSVILAASELGGMGHEYFERKTRHILPVVDKTLISYLIDVLDKGGLIKNKYTIIEETINKFERKMICEPSYKELFKERINNDIHLFGQDPLTRSGTFEAVRRFLLHEDGNEKFPLLICYGDTVIEAEFLKRIIDKYFSMKSNPAKIVWGLVKQKEENYLFSIEDIIDPLGIAIKIKNESDPFSKFIKSKLSTNLINMLDECDGTTIHGELLSNLISEINNLIKGPIIYDEKIFPNIELEHSIKDAHDQISNENDQMRMNKYIFSTVYEKEILILPKLAGYIVAEKSKTDSEFSELDVDKIMNVFENSAINLEDSIRQINTFDIFIDTGIMLVSKEAWDKIISIVREVRRPSSKGMFSLVNILKQILIFRGVEIKSANKYDPSKEIKDRSTPYQEQQVKFEDLGIDISCILAPDNHWSDITYPWELLELNNKMLIQIVEGADWSEDKLNNIGKETILFPKDLEVVIKDAPKITGPCIIKGPCILGRNLKIGNNVYIEGSFIGDNTEIGNFATIRNSNLVKGVHITENVVIENSIIMENSTIYCNCVIVSSILGKYVSTGIGTKFPCRRLKKIEYIPKDRKVTYFSDIKIENPNEFGSIIGDYCQIGSGTLIHPGRRIGKRSIISANSQVLKNLRPNSVIK